MGTHIVSLRRARHEPQSIEEGDRRTAPGLQASRELVSRNKALTAIEMAGEVAEARRKRRLPITLSAIPRPAFLPPAFPVRTNEPALGHIPRSVLSTQPTPSPKEKQRGSAGYIADLGGGALDNTSRCDPQALSETASSGLARAALPARSSLEPDADSVRR